MGVGGVFMGPVVFSTISNDLPIWLHYTLVISFWLPLGLLIFFYGNKLSKTEKAFLLGIMISLLTIYVISGTYAVSPGIERASLFYCLPLCVIFAILLSHSRFGLHLSI